MMNVMAKFSLWCFVVGSFHAASGLSTVNNHRQVRKVTGKPIKKVGE